MIEFESTVIIILHCFCIGCTGAGDGEQSATPDATGGEEGAILGKLHELDFFGELAVLLQERPGVPFRRGRSAYAITSTCTRFSTCLVCVCLSFTYIFITIIIIPMAISDDTSS